MHMKSTKTTRKNGTNSSAHCLRKHVTVKQSTSTASTEPRVGTVPIVATSISYLRYMSKSKYRLKFDNATQQTTLKLKQLAGPQCSEITGSAVRFVGYDTKQS